MFGASRLSQFFWLVVVLSLPISFLFGLRSWLPELGLIHLNDDAMINMRVAKVMAAHGVPYFNPGEAVAANSSLLWPLVLAMVHHVGVAAETTILGLHLASILLFALTAAAAARLLEDPLAQIGVFVSLALGSSGLIYGGSAWEHVPQMAAITAGGVFFLRGLTRQTALAGFYCFAAGFALRPDLAVAIAALACALLIALPGRDRWAFVLGSLPALVIPLAHGWGMQAFYGELMPNTYYLKMTDRGDGLWPGLAYVINPRDAGLVPVLTLVALLCWRGLSAGARVFLVSLLAHMVYVVSAGGDFFTDGRFFLAFLPIVTVIAAGQLVQLGRSRLVLFAGLGYAVISVGGNLDLLEKRVSGSVISQLRLVDLIRREVAPSEGSVGLHFAGIGYHLPEHHIVDFLGKAEPTIARGASRYGPVGHDKWDYGYAFATYDIAVAPMSHPPWEDFDPSMSAALAERQGYVAAMMHFVSRLDSHVYLSPVQLCLESDHGLLVRRDLMERFACQ